PTQGTLGPVTLEPDGTATVPYTPNPDFNGSDEFSFQASDGEGVSAPAIVRVTVTPQNDAPVAGDQNLVQAQDTVFSFTLAASDADDDPLTYAIVTPPDRGTISGTAPNLTYTPPFDEIGR